MLYNIKDLHFAYRASGPEVLRGVNLQIREGTLVALLGSAGAGKTTAIRILMNVFPANSGQVLIDDKPIDYAAVGIGYLPEERGLYPKKVIIDQVESKVSNLFG